MRTFNFFRSMLCSLLGFGAIVVFLVGVSATDVQAQCPTITIVPSTTSCCFEIRMTNTAANTWTDLTLFANMPNLTGVVKSAVSNPPVANIPNLKYTFTPSGSSYWGVMTNVVVGRFCITGNTLITITVHGTNGQVCQYPAQQLMCNNPIGGGTIGNPPVGGGNPFGGSDWFPVLKKEGNASDELPNTTVSSISVAPNPATTQATVRFSSAQALSNVVLSISDITGREVLRVLDGASLTSGSYDIPVNAEQLTTGMYQITLRSEGMALFNTTMSVLR